MGVATVEHTTTPETGESGEGVKLPMQPWVDIEIG